MNKKQRIAYLAGFFDGEGCVYILQGKRAGNGSDAFGLEVSITNSDPLPLEIARAEFGGRISLANKSRSGYRTIYRLRIRARQAAAALKTMLPYLLVKKERAEIAIAFQEKMRPGPTPSMSVEEALDFKGRITAMNDKVWNARPT